MRRSKRTTVGAAVFASAALLVGVLSGCDSVSGTAESTAPDLSGLDVGAFGGEPITEPHDGTESYGRIVESVRMAEGVLNPYDIDPAFAFGHPSLLPTPGDTTGILAEVARPVLTARGMISGYTVGGADRVDASFQPIIGQSKSLRITVVRLPDETAARTAAMEIEAADFAVSLDNIGVPIPKYGKALSHWRPQLPTLGVTVAHGPYVVTLFVTHPTTDLPAMTAIATATLDAELPRLDRFVPTPADKLAALPFDTDGMLRRALPSQPGHWPYPSITALDRGTIAGYGGVHGASGVVYGASGADQWTREVSAEGAKPDHPVVDRMAVVDDRWLLRLQDPVRARKYFDTRAAEFAQADEALPAVQAVPDATCFRSRDNRMQFFYCQVLDGRYLANVYAPDEKTVRQMAAAQYALLVKTR
ncbi:hypothetical protein F3087_03520 [Nocardia colli]|uniref:Uncharacterized protein n=1 Tax=Nocardia colli TaxID=2545717 RepID=A0A5N0ELU7_9NOCA|nr:hypothetical protein [Nocardia colli]KAA8890378.1 hypothetical protein F3087_03520 [Nocardia colli]